MLNKAPNTPTIGDFLARIRERRTRDHDNLRRLLRLLLPLLPEAHVDHGALLDDVELDELASRLPAFRLFDCLTPDNKAWAAWVLENRPEFGRVRAYKSDYRRCLVRCLDHMVASKLLSLAVRGVAPAWQEARDELKAIIPSSQRVLKARLEAGETMMFGVSLTAKPFKTTWTRCRTMIDQLNRMGRHMTALGVRSPQEVRPEHIYGGENSWYQAFDSRQRMGYYHSREGWNILKHLHPEWDLVDFPRARQASQFGLMPHERPPLLLEALAAVDALKGLAPSTQRRIREHLTRYVGYLKHIEGLDVDRLCRLQESADDLLYLLMGGFPPTMDGRMPQADEEARRLFEDEEYMDEIARGIVSINVRRAGREEARANPLLRKYQDWNLQRGKAASIEVALKSFRILGEHHLRIHRSQRTWIDTMIKEVMKSKRLQAASPRAERKAVIEADLGLWGKLVAARPRIAAATERRRAEMALTLADAAKTDAQKEHAKIRWAVAVRDELLVGMWLAFTLRKGNIQNMQIGVDIFPAEYRISIPNHRTKSKERIRKTLPATGPFADLKGLLDTYLMEARPILLGGRRDTPYFFLTTFKGVEAVDEGGYLRPSRDKLPKIVQAACEKHFKDILPDGLDVFNPHLIRDAFTNFAYHMGEGELLLMQGLNNTAEVARRHYLGKLQKGDDKLTAFLEDPGIEKRKKGPKERKQERQALRARVERILGGEANVSTVNELMRLIDQKA